MTFAAPALPLAGMSLCDERTVPSHRDIAKHLRYHSRWLLGVWIFKVELVQGTDKRHVGLESCHLFIQPFAVVKGSQVDPLGTRHDVELVPSNRSTHLLCGLD